MNKSALAAAIAVIASLALTEPAMAQPYPAKPVRVLVSGGAGGPNDVQNRAIAQILSANLGQPFVIENRAGAQGTLALEACARATPDGYTLCTGATNNINYMPTLRLNLPYEPLKDFAPVAHTGFVDAGIQVHASIPVATMDELIAYAKAKPGVLNWASFGPNTSSFYFMESLRRTRGAEFLHVPYKSSAQSQQALIAGEVQVNLYSVGQALSQIKAGKLKVLAVMGSRRLPYMPAAPTLKEAGVDLPLSTWYMQFAPAGTPKDIVLRLNGEVNKLMTSAQFVEKFMTPIGVSPPDAMSPEELSVFMKRMRDGFAEVAKTIGLKPE
ncbi:MAG: hypothetical protein A3H35_05220 [Betaproteobacteria bacterium RIFCSPLOWO2_02_FULL_62_17]|nr:MAG: hypothetical protein A3H35_05220 [Betaproteobacteria bacterium RIFCSPLOWO2_02_FULL_62_17]